MFNEADDIRDELLNVHGVTVWDRDLMWTTKGGRGGRGRGRGGDRFAVIFPSGPKGSRYIFPILTGTFEGADPNFHGTIAAPSADFAIGHSVSTYYAPSFIHSILSFHVIKHII